MNKDKPFSVDINQTHELFWFFFGYFNYDCFLKGNRILFDSIIHLSISNSAFLSDNTCIKHRNDFLGYVPGL